MSRTSLPAAAGVLAGVLFLAGCGGSSTPSAASSRPASASTAVTTAAPTTTAASSAAPTGTAGGSPAAGGTAAAGGTGGATADPSSTGDDVDATVPVGTPTTLPPVAVGAPATTTGATVVLARAEAVTGEAQGAGQVAGPAVRLTVTVTNTGSSALALGGVTVDLHDAGGAPAPALSGPGARAFTGTLAPGAGADAVYVFGLADDDRTGVQLLVSLAAGVPVVVVTGDLPR